MSGLPGQAVFIRVTAAAAVLAVGVAGCGADPAEIEWPDDPSPPLAQAPPSASPDVAEAAVVEEVLSVVQDFREAEVASYADPRPPHFARRDLSDVLADPFLTETVDTIYRMHQAGIVFEGRPTWDLTVTDLRLDDTPPTATVRDCFDATDWQSVFRETGDPVPGDTITGRYVAQVHLKLYPEGWLVHKTDRKAEQC